MRKDSSKSYQYIENLIPAESESMKRARAHSERLGLAGISLSAVEAQFIRFFASEKSVSKAVEIGTLTGLSALYFLEAAKHDAKLWTLEKSSEHATLATDALAEYIDSNRCEIIVGDASENLHKINKLGPFDFIFIDGNKAAYLDYFNWAVENISSGGIIMVDNVFLSGAVWGGETKQRFNSKQIAAVNGVNKRAFELLEFKSLIIPTDEGMLVCKKLS